MIFQVISNGSSREQEAEPHLVGQVWDSNTTQVCASKVNCLHHTYIILSKWAQTKEADLLRIMMEECLLSTLEDNKCRSYMLMRYFTKAWKVRLMLIRALVSTTSVGSGLSQLTHRSVRQRRSSLSQRLQRMNRNISIGRSLNRVIIQVLAPTQRLFQCPFCSQRDALQRLGSRSASTLSPLWRTTTVSTSRLCRLLWEVKSPLRTTTLPCLRSATRWQAQSDRIVASLSVRHRIASKCPLRGALALHLQPTRYLTQLAYRESEPL